MTSLTSVCGEPVRLFTLASFPVFLVPISAAARLCPVYVRALVFIWCNPCGSLDK